MITRGLNLDQKAQNNSACLCPQARLRPVNISTIALPIVFDEHELAFKSNRFYVKSLYTRILVIFTDAHAFICFRRIQIHRDISVCKLFFFIYRFSTAKKKHNHVKLNILLTRNAIVFFYQFYTRRIKLRHSRRVSVLIISGTVICTCTLHVKMRFLVRLTKRSPWHSLTKQAPTKNRVLFLKQHTHAWHVINPLNARDNVQ